MVWTDLPALIAALCVDTANLSQALRKSAPVAAMPPAKPADLSFSQITNY